MALSASCCLGRHTITGWLTAAGQQQADWSGAYRLFAKERLDLEALFRPLAHGVLARTPADAPVFAALDDSLLRKRGKHVAGTAWRRDPLGPAFQTNLVWGQRVLQTALLLPESPQADELAAQACRARAVPVTLQLCPVVPKPADTASAEQQAQYRRQQELVRLPALAQGQLAALREELDAAPGGPERTLVVAVDGAYTNRTLFRHLPGRTTLIGRCRKDAALFAPPPTSSRGRPRVYGQPLATPEEVRQDKTISWQEVQAYAAGRWHTFNVKIVRNVRWKGAGDRNLTLVVIRPLGYRHSRTSRVLYRQPAYLLCSDPTLAIELILQAYLWRWEIEVCFRDEKTLLGMGEAQVRNPAAAATVPAFVAAVYGYLHLAAAEAGITAGGSLPRPKWQSARPGERYTTSHLQRQARTELWGRALGLPTFAGFTTRPTCALKPPIITHPAAAAVLYAQK
jgi:hypothetical protein